MTVFGVIDSGWDKLTRREFIKSIRGDKSSVYILEGKELNADELIMELAERGKIFLNFDKDISKFGVEVTL